MSLGRQWMSEIWLDRACDVRLPLTNSTYVGPLSTSESVDQPQNLLEQFPWHSDLDSLGTATSTIWKMT